MRKESCITPILTAGIWCVCHLIVGTLCSPPFLASHLNSPCWEHQKGIAKLLSRIFCLGMRLNVRGMCINPLRRCPVLTSFIPLYQGSLFNTTTYLIACIKRSYFLLEFQFPPQPAFLILELVQVRQSTTLPRM